MRGEVRGSLSGVPSQFVESIEFAGFVELVGFVGLGGRSASGVRGESAFVASNGVRGPGSKARSLGSLGW
jgi:hypothetical protein